MDKSWHVADEAEVDGYPLCAWSRDQLGGHGRIHPATFEDAVRIHGTPAEATPLIKQHLRFVTYDEIWLPYSKSYVALGLKNRVVAWFGKGYVEVGSAASTCRATSPDGPAAATRGRRTAQPAPSAA